MHTAAHSTHSLTHTTRYMRCDSRPPDCAARGYSSKTVHHNPHRPISPDVIRRERRPKAPLIAVPAVIMLYSHQCTVAARSLLLARSVYMLPVHNLEFGAKGSDPGYQS